jgi:hypothetical protein
VNDDVTTSAGNPALRRTLRTHGGGESCTRMHPHAPACTHFAGPQAKVENEAKSAESVASVGRAGSYGQGPRRFGGARAPWRARARTPARERREVRRGAKELVEWSGRTSRLHKTQRVNDPMTRSERTCP